MSKETLTTCRKEIGEMGFLFDQKFATVVVFKKQTSNKVKNPNVFVLKPGYTFTAKGPFDLELHFFLWKLE